MIRHPLVAFNSGEVTPKIDSRSDVDKYRAACRTLENFIPLIYGPAERRPGTKYIDTCNGVSRIMPFIYSNTIAYIVLMEDLRFWFYYDGGRVLDDSARRLGIDTPYLAADLFEIQYKQSNDVMWLVHGDYAPRKLSRTSATAFSLATITFTDGPFIKRNDLANDDDITLTPGATTGSSTLTASDDVFTSTNLGSLFYVVQPRVNTSVSGSATGTGVIDASIIVEGDFSFNTHGTWTGTIELQRSIDDSTWETYRMFPGVNDRNVQYTGTEEDADVYYRMNVTAYTSGTISADLNVNTSTQTGICRITGYVSATSATMTVLKDFASTNADVRWAEGCWSPRRGYPKTVTFFDGRCIYAGTDHQPQTLWFSAVDDYENFNECVKDDSAFSLTFSSETRNAIQWINGLEALIAGTSGGEWRIRSSSLDEPITPTNFSAKVQTTYGSKSIQALAVNDVLLMVDFVGRKVREITYSGTKEKFVAQDLTAMAEHITLTSSDYADSGIVGHAFQKNPDPIYWACRADGTLLSMTYEREQDVVAWARHPFDVGFGTDGERIVTSTVDRYPTLQELPSAEIPDAQSIPDDITLVAPISITNSGQLQAMVAGNHYSIDANIDLSGVTWTPLVFEDLLDETTVIEGNNYTISNLTIEGTASKQGLIGSVGYAGVDDMIGGGQIRNLHFANCSVTGGDDIAIMCGWFYPKGLHSPNTWSFKNITFAYCSVAHAATGGGSYDDMGVMFGELSGECTYISECTATGCHVTSTHMGMYIGGLIGQLNNTAYPPWTGEASTIVNCDVVGGTMTLSGVNTYFSGGFIGGDTASKNESWEIIGCSSSMDIAWTAPSNTQTLSAMGGFIGSTIYTTIVTCSATGDITVDTGGYASDGAQNIGGFSGAFQDVQVTAINCYATGSITLSGTSDWGTVSRIGGFVGWSEAEHQLTRCYATSAITVENAVALVHAIGGFVGRIEPQSGSQLFSRCWSEGDITFEDKIVAGYDGAAAEDQGHGYGFIGGFAGYIDYGTVAADITNCYAWSSIVIDGTYPLDLTLAGFVAGYGADIADLVVTNCYCAQTDTMYGSEYTGQIPTGNDSHGFGGEAIVTGAATALYFDQETSSITEDNIAAPHTTEWMQTQANYEAGGWGFDTVWTMPPVETTIDYTAEGLGPNSVAVIPSTTEDEVWLIIYRYINETGVRYLEQMQPREVDDQEDMWFVDSGLSLDVADDDGIVSGLDHLETHEVCALVDGAVAPRQTVASGSVNVGSAILGKAIIGLPFRYTLQPMRFDLDISGTTHGTLKRFAEAVISFYRTLNAEYGVDVNTLFDIDWRTEEAFGSPPALYTGDKIVAHEGGFSTEDPFVITGDDPLPCTVRAIIPRLRVTGR